MMNPILKEDLSEIINTDIHWEKLNNSTIFITGFRGMIGSYITRVCIYLNENLGYNIRIIGLELKPSDRDQEFIEHKNMRIIYQL